MVRGVVLMGLLLVQGCDWVFGLELRDAPLIDARVARPGCSGMRIFADRFEDGTFEPEFYADRNPPQNEITVSGMGLRMGMVRDGYAAVFSGHLYDLRDDSVSIEVHAENNLLPGAGELSLEVRAEELNALVIRRRGAGMEMIRRINGVEYVTGTFPYDPVAHRFWKIGQQDNVSSWLTSSDGIEFVERAVFLDLPFDAFMGVVLRAHRPAATAAFTAWFDQLNGGTPTGEACPAFALTDDFADGVIGKQWAPTSNNNVIEVDGHLVARMNQLDSEAYIESATVYDLRDGELTLELPQRLPDDPVDTILQVTTDAGGGAMFRVRTGRLRAMKNAGIEVGSEPYDPVAQRWWRLRIAGDMIYWEVSPDRITYRVIGQANDVAGLERSGIRLGIVGQPSGAIEATFDNFNVAAP